jgi:hypothetical protein
MSEHWAQSTYRRTAHFPKQTVQTVKRTPLKVFLRTTDHYNDRIRYAAALDNSYGNRGKENAG